MTADSLAAFLEARWDEQKRDALKAMGHSPGQWASWSHRAHKVGLRDLACGGERLAELPVDIDEHIARHDPAYVLADIEAKRRIVELYKEERSRVLAYRSPRWKDAMNEQDKVEWHKQEARHRVAEDFALALAQPFASHPDFLPEWAWENR